MLAEKHGLSAKQAKAMLHDYQETVAKEAKKTGRVRTVLGVFSIKKVPAQKGGKKAKNPFTGEEYVTKAKPATVKLKFRPSKTAKGLIGGRAR